MSGLFNMLMGTNPAIGYLMAVLGITQETKDKWPLGRLRDAYTNEDGTKVFIFTRNGGLDQESAVQIEKNLRDHHPNYVGFEIDDFDSTYLTYEFNTPEDLLHITKQIAEMTETEPPMVRFRRLLDDMKTGKSNPMVDNAMEVGKKIFDPILNGESGVVEHGDGSVQIHQIKPEDT